MSLDDHLDALSRANSAAELAKAHRAATRAVLSNRRQAERQGVGVLARTIAEALKLRDEMKAGGASQAELDAFLENVVRQSWPFTREWKFLCSQCDDTGRVVMVCRKGARCDGRSTAPGRMRLCAQDPTSDYEHEYASPCHCALGSRFTSRPKRVEDDLVKIGKVSKPTRFGR